MFQFKKFLWGKLAEAYINIQSFQNNQRIKRIKVFDFIDYFFSFEKFLWGKPQRQTASNLIKESK